MLNKNNLTTKINQISMKSKNIIILFVVMIILSVCFASCNSPKLNLHKSNNFDGKRFNNLTNLESEKTLAKFLKWQFQSKKDQWPKWVDIKQSQPKYHNVKNGELSVTFINHATLLIQIDGINILTDPVYSQRTSPVTFLGPKRVKLPGVKFKDLPKIDLVLISHNHYDSFDIKTLRRLILRDKPKILFGLGNSHYLDKKHQKNAVEMNWYDEFDFQDLKLTFLPTKHWSKRNLWDTNKALWGSFAIQGSRKIYFAGDTGYSDHFKEIQKKFDYFDLSLIPIGAYEPRWFMKDYHINPEEAVKAHLELKSKKSIAMHFGTFQLTNEAIHDPVEDLKKAKLKYNIRNNDFVALKEGESYAMP